MNRQRELTDILNKWAYEYYVLDNPTVSDKEYDMAYDELCRLEKESGVVFDDSPTRRVGGEPLKGFQKHTHIARLFSLDKAVSEEELLAFLTRVDKLAAGEKEYTVDPSEFASMGKATPFADWKLFAECVATVYGGKVVYSNFH